MPPVNETVDGEIRLPFKVYERLGGLKGIINEAGETALAPLGEAEKARLFGRSRRRGRRKRKEPEAD
jgi:hypothetical protein